MRLWAKTWAETRVRFAIAVAAMIASCAFARGEGPQTIFLLLAITLGGGTLRQDPAVLFTLALPVTRARLLAARLAVGILEIAALAAVIAVATHSLALGAWWAGCGVLVLACAIASAAVVANEYAGWLVAFAVVMGYEVGIHAISREPAFDFYEVMQGGAGPTALLGLGFASAALVAVTHLRLRRRDP